MAKMFYTTAEAAQKLGKTETAVKDLVREGKLREFRDAGSINYKVDDVDRLAASVKGSSGGTASAAPSVASRTASASSKAGSSVIKATGGSTAGGEILLEPVEDSSVELSPGGSDILSLEEVDAESTAIGARAKKEKEGTVVPSVGVNVFDDEELDEHVDPLAQTAVTDLAGMGLEGAGSGSGIMDLTRESDDTSLGQELLDEIYIEDEKKDRDEAEDTRAGLEEVATEEPPTADEDEATLATTAPGTRRVARTAVVEVGADPLTSSLTALLVVAVFVLWVAGLGAAALVRGVTPALLQWLYGNLMFAALGALVIGGLAFGVTYFVSKRSS